MRRLVTALADSSDKQSRVERLETFRARRFDGDKSPAKSGENSPYSKSVWLRSSPRQGVRRQVKIVIAATLMEAHPDFCWPKRISI